MIIKNREALTPPVSSAGLPALCVRAPLCTSAFHRDNSPPTPPPGPLTPPRPRGRHHFPPWESTSLSPCSLILCLCFAILQAVLCVSYLCLLFIPLRVLGPQMFIIFFFLSWVWCLKSYRSAVCILNYIFIYEPVNNTIYWTNNKKKLGFISLSPSLRLKTCYTRPGCWATRRSLSRKTAWRASRPTESGSTSWWMSRWCWWRLSTLT